LFATITAGVGVVLAVAASEAVVRGWEAWRARHPAPAPPAPPALDLLRPNPNGTGSYRLKPDVDITTRVGSRTVRVRTNSHGMAWREVSREKALGRARVAFLGDSFTFGCWADTVEKSFVGVVDTRLAGGRWEVLNFGVGGYGLADEDLLLREEVIRWSPDYVIVVIYNGNDFRDTFLGLNRERIVDGTAVLDPETVGRKVPAELLPEDNTVSRPVADRSPVQRWLGRLAAYRLVSSRLDLNDPAVEFAVNRNFTMYSFWSQFPYPEAARRAKDESLATLGRMDVFLAEHRARLALVALPTSEQVYATRLAGPGYDLAFPQVYVQTFARERGIAYLDLLPAFRQHVRESGERIFLERDTHLNNAGHALAGALIAEWFQCCVRASSLHAGR
jgi:hypothetical protein